MGGDAIPLRTDYEAVAASQTDQALGPNGGKQGDILERIVVTVTTAATSAASIKDGAAGPSIPIVPANTPIGVYHVDVGARARLDGWKATTAAGVSLLCVGRFQ